MWAPGWVTRYGIPSAAHRRNSSMNSWTLFAQKFGSVAARLMR
jgi:hypothetical protein